MSKSKTPRQRLITHTVDHLIDARKAAAEKIGMSRVGLRYLDPDDADGDALRIHRAIEEVAPLCPAHNEAMEYLNDINARAWRRLVCAVARAFNERMDTKRRARIARRRQRTRERLYGTD